jgi:hypothetical protein
MTVNLIHALEQIYHIKFDLFNMSKVDINENKFDEDDLIVIALPQIKMLIQINVLNLNLLR